MKIRKILTTAAALLAVCVLASGNGLNLNGLGSRAISMGGAYVGLANDFSSLFWNPAGLAHIRNKTFGFYGADILPSGSYNYSVSYPAPVGTLTLVDAKTLTKNYLGGMAVYVQPVTSNLVVAMGVYTPSGSGAAWDGADMGALSGGATNLDWSSKVGLVTFAPSIAYRLNDMFTFGASLNINYGMFDLSTYGGSIPGLIDLGQYTESETGWGLGATFGMQFQPHPMVRLGLVYRTSSTVKFSGTAEMSQLQILGASPESDMTRDLTWPAWLAGGIAIMPTDRLTVTADIQYTNWKKIETLDTAYLNPFWSLLMTTAGQTSIPMAWRDAVQIRFGAEYKLSPSLAIRGGYYNDPAPAPDETMTILLPNYDFNVLTFGLGYETKGLSLDFGVEVLMGKERSIGAELVDAMPGVYNMKILLPTISVHYKF
ncbi:MAG: outer membrane protein transport protein [Candidatus Aminicenantes bacterium]|nr:outer membrane protein transport protein [Candidatus Aminicenantes bacterium]